MPRPARTSGNPHSAGIKLTQPFIALNCQNLQDHLGQVPAIPSVAFSDLSQHEAGECGPSDATACYF